MKLLYDIIITSLMKTMESADISELGQMTYHFGKNFPEKYIFGFSHLILNFMFYLNADS